MNLLVSRRRWIAYPVAFLLTMMASGAAADTLTLAWDPSPAQNVAGYVVYVGTQSGVYTVSYDVGNSLAFAYSNAVPGQSYYFAVAAYAPGPVIGAKSPEVSGVTNAAPTLLNPGNQSSTVGSTVSLQLSGSDPAGQTLTYGVTQLPPGLSVAPATGRISGTPTTPGSYLVTAVASDGILSDSETFTWTVTVSPAAPVPVVTDSAPIVTITVPTSAGIYNTDQTFVTLGGTATDNGVVTEVTWSSDRGSSGRATGTDSWIAGITLQRGPNTITVKARDDKGNISSGVIVVKSTGKAK